MQHWFHRFRSGRRAATNPPANPGSGHGQLGASNAALERDRGLLARWRDGDSSAGLELLDHYAAHERMTAFRLGIRAPQELLELHQDVVLRVLDRLPRLADELGSSFGGWLAWQVRDLVQRRRRAADPRNVPIEQAEPADADPHERSVAWDAITNCCRRLPERERAVFELRYVEGLSLQEVADRLTSNGNAVAQCVFRLVRRMRACLHAQGYEPQGGEA